MSYDYGNARIRAMKSRLLSARALEVIAESITLEQLIGELAQTAYRNDILAAMLRFSGMECLEAAFRWNLVGTLGKIKSFFSGWERELISLMLRSYDVHNLKAVLRGISKHAAPEDIKGTFLPIGELTDSILSNLVRAVEPRVVIDMLASMRVPIIHPIVKLRTQKPGVGITEMELALEKWHFQDASERLATGRQGADSLQELLNINADLQNVFSVLRIVRYPSERKVLLDWLGSDDIHTLLVGPGFLKFGLLASAATEKSVQAMVDVLSGTRYENPLRAGLEEYAQSNRLSDFERHLNQFRLRWMATRMTKDPLGIGVSIGYVGRKVHEVANLRRITHGVQMRQSPDIIKNSLEIVL
jgi:vacuolar-type H+-ATPase subunit C/Vma6